MKIILIILFLTSLQNFKIISSEYHSSFLQNKVELQYASENKSQEKLVNHPKGFAYNLIKFTTIKQDAIIEQTHNLKLESNGILITLEDDKEDLIKYSE